MAEVCAKAASCLMAGIDGPFGMSAWCWFLDGAPDTPPIQTGFKRQLSDLYRCVEAADGCDEVVACAAASEQELAACVSGSRMACSGDVLVACNVEVEDYAFDCAPAGLTCGALDEWACCGLGPCDPSAGEQPSCNGDRLVTCSARCGMFVETDCRYYCGDNGCVELDATCGIGESGTPACMGAGEPCDPEELEGHCEGSTFVTCYNGGLSALDCEAHAPPGMSFECVSGACRAGTECDLSDSETCEGATARFCVEGQWQQVDCLALGFSGCTADGSHRVTCVP